MPSTFPSGTYGHMITTTSGLQNYMRLGDAGPNTGDDGLSLVGTGSNVLYQQAGALAGDPNTSAYFNGTNSYINFGDSNRLTGSFSVEIWIKPTQEYTSGYHTFLSKENYNVPWSGWGFWLEGRSAANGGMRAVFARLNGGTSYVSSRVYSSRVYANQWTHLVVTYDGTTLRLYRNGVYEWDVPSYGGMNESNYVLLAGAESNINSTYYAAHYKGYLDELATYNRALTGSECLSHYNRGIIPPVQYYSLSDAKRILSTDAYGAGTPQMSLNDPSLPKLNRTETKSQQGFASLSDTPSLGVQETNSIVTVFAGTIASYGETAQVSATTSVLGESTSIVTDAGRLFVSEQRAVFSQPDLVDASTLGATEAINVQRVVRASIAYPVALRRQSGFVHFVVSRFVDVPYIIHSKFNDVVPVDTIVRTEFVVIDHTYNPLALGWVDTRWSTTLYPIIVDVSLEVDSHLDLLEEFGLSQKQQD